MNNDILFEKTLALLTETGLNWTVKKEALVSSIEGKPTESYGLFRSDNGLHLGTVGKRYEVYDNFQLAEAIIQASEEVGLVTTRGGILRDGRKVYLQAELPEVFIGKSGMQRFITGVNAHDATRSIGFGSTGTVIVCQNTWHRAYGNLSKFIHSASANERIMDFVKGMRQAMGLDEKLIKQMQVMADTPIKDEIIARVMKAAFEVDVDKPQSKATRRESTKVKDMISALEQEIKLEGPTLWGLFNGVTRYTNHMAVKPERAKEYVMTGKGYDTNLVAFDTIMRWIEENSELPAELVGA